MFFVGVRKRRKMANWTKTRKGVLLAAKGTGTMITARIMTHQSFDGTPADFAEYEFLVLPRPGEHIEFAFDPWEQVKVVSVLHTPARDNEPPSVIIFITSPD
jgi:hypothetical protein